MQIEINNRSRTQIDETEIGRLVRYFGKSHGLGDKELSIAIIGDKVMRRLNREYRGIDKPTDILSFEGDDELLGELVIDMSQLRRQKPVYSEILDEELCFMIVHGLLHLVGYDDEEEEDRLEMISIGKKIMNSFKKLK